MAIAMFMILNQLQIAPEIVTITYAALIGGVFLAMALAFGLGGREVAGQMLGDAYDKGRESKGQVKDDMRTGKDRAQRDAETVKDKAQDRARRLQRRPRAAPGGVPPVAHSAGESSGRTRRRRPGAGAIHSGDTKDGIDGTEQHAQGRLAGEGAGADRRPGADPTGSSRCSSAAATVSPQSRRRGGHGKTWLGLELNGWSSLLFIGAGALLCSGPRCTGAPRAVDGRRHRPRRRGGPRVGRQGQRVRDLRRQRPDRAGLARRRRTAALSRWSHGSAEASRRTTKRTTTIATSTASAKCVVARKRQPDDRETRGRERPQALRAPAEGPAHPRKGGAADAEAHVDRVLEDNLTDSAAALDLLRGAVDLPGAASR